MEKTLPPNNMSSQTSVSNTALCHPEKPESDDTLCLRATKHLSQGEGHELRLQDSEITLSGSPSSPEKVMCKSKDSDVTEVEQQPKNNHRKSLVRVKYL